MRKSTLIVVIVLVVALVLLVTGNVVVRHVRTKREKRRIMDVCGDNANNNNSIFVTLVSYRDAVGAARTIDSLFSMAHCPLRVYVGLCEFHDDLHSVVAMYKDVCASNGSAFALADHIRVLRVPYGESKGAFTAREHVERYLYRSEAYVLSLDSPARLAKGWDKYLIDTLAAAALGGAGKRVVLSTQPEALSSNPNAPAPSLDQPGTFLATMAATPVPRFAGYKLKKVPLDAVVPAVAWSAALAFSTGARIAEVPYPKDVTCCEDVEDFFMTLALRQQGYRLFHPAAQVAMAARRSALPPRGDGSPGFGLNAEAGMMEADTHADADLPANNSAGERLEQELQCRFRLMRAASAWPVFRATVQSMGVTADMAQVTARGRMGLTQSPATEELEAKLGSTGEYLSLLSRIDLRGA